MIDNTHMMTPHANSQNVHYQPKTEKMNDSHINSKLFDERMYFKSIETNMHKQKSPIAETRHSFNRMLQLQESTEDSLFKESIMEIPEGNEDLE